VPFAAESRESCFLRLFGIALAGSGCFDDAAGDDSVNDARLSPIVQVFVGGVECLAHGPCRMVIKYRTDVGFFVMNARMDPMICHVALAAEMAAQPSGRQELFWAGRRAGVFGHYWLKGQPCITAPNAACLDFSVANEGYLTAYRWSGERELTEKALEFVPA
jgi:hypothetical protein